MNDARRWRDAMAALGLEWRVGMVSQHGEVCVPCSGALGLIEGAREDVMVDYNGHSEDLAVGLTTALEGEHPDPHHPSNLGHLVAMVCEVYGVTDVRWAFVRFDEGDGAVCIWSDQHEMRKGPPLLIGKVDVERWEDASIGDVPCALLDALERKAREGV